MLDLWKIFVNGLPIQKAVNTEPGGSLFLLLKQIRFYQKVGVESFKLTLFVNNKDLASLTPQIKDPYEPSKSWKLYKFAVASNFINFIFIL